jgi:hypothetical protein
VLVRALTGALLSALERLLWSALFRPLASVSSLSLPREQTRVPFHPSPEASGAGMSLPQCTKIITFYRVRITF